MQGASRSPKKSLHLLSIKRTFPPMEEGTKSRTGAEVRKLKAVSTDRFNEGSDAEFDCVTYQTKDFSPLDMKEKQTATQLDGNIDQSRTIRWFLSPIFHL